MKKIFFLISFAFSFAGCFAQGTTTFSNAVILKKTLQGGSYTTAQMPDSSKCVRCIVYNTDSNSYAFSTGFSWVYFGRGGGSISTLPFSAITGSPTSNTQLANALNAKMAYSDTANMLLAYARSVLVVKYSDTANMLVAYMRVGTGVKYSDTLAMLTPYLRIANFTKAGIGLGNVLDNKQVHDMGGIDSLMGGPFASIPSAATGPTLYFATDTLAWYYNNGSSYTKVSGSGGGGGGGTADSSVFLTRYRATVTYVPLTSFNTAGLETALGFTPYNATNPNGYISANQTITLQNNSGSDVSFSTTGSILLQPTVTVNANAITYAKMQQNPAKTLIGNYITGTANNGAVYTGSGIIWSTDTLKVDTSLLVTANALSAHGYLSSESDPIATKDTINISTVAGTGVLLTGTAKQALGGSPTWVIKSDTSVLATLSNVNGKTITITGTAGRGILISGTPAQLLGASPSWTFTADTTYLATKYYAGTQAFSPKTLTLGYGLLGTSYNATAAVTAVIDSTKYSTSLALADTAHAIRTSVTAFDSASSQGGGFHTQPYNDVRYRKTWIDSLWAGLIRDTTKILHNGSIWGVYTTGSSDTIYDKAWNNVASPDVWVKTGTDSALYLVLKQKIVAGSCTSCNLTYDSAGNIIVAANGTGGAGNTNLSIQMFANFDSVKSSTGTGAELDTANATTGGHAGLQSYFGYTVDHSPIYIKHSLCVNCDTAAYANFDTLYLVGTEPGYGMVKQNSSIDSLIYAVDTSKIATQADITNLTANLSDTSSVLRTAISLKSPLASPGFTGTPTAPTASPGTNTTQLATTQYVVSALGSYAPLAGPTFTGVPAAPTAANGTNTTQLATTQFVQNAITAVGSGVTTVLPFSASSQTNGAAISGVNITFGPADATNPGMVTTGTQTIAGAKTFNGNVAAPAGVQIASNTNTMQWIGTATGSWAASLNVPGTSSHTGSDWYLSYDSSSAWKSRLHGYGSGQFQFSNYGNHAFTGTLAYGLGEDASGNIIELTKGVDFSQGTSSLPTGIIKSTTSTGAFTIAVASDFPTLNQNTTGTAGGLLSTASLPNGVTAVTQSNGDNSTKLATTAYVGTAVSSYAPLANPALTGVPTAPTATSGTNSTQLATTAFVATSFAPLASAALTGIPTAPTAGSGTNTQQLATTAFVQTATSTFTANNYAPTITTTTNIGSIQSSGNVNWIRIGNTVFGNGWLTCIPNASGVNATINIPLPVASTSGIIGSGPAVANYGTSYTNGFTLCTPSSGYAQITFAATQTVASELISYSFSYTVQ